MTKISSLYIRFLNVAASAQKLGMNLIRIAILVIFVWIGGLKFWNLGILGYVLPESRAGGYDTDNYYDRRHTLVLGYHAGSLGARFG